MHILLKTGLRISEAVGLVWDNVDMVQREITIDHQVQYRKVNGVSHYYANDTKTEAGCDIKVLQYIFGHTDIRTTMRVYNHINSDRVKREMDKLENLHRMKQELCRFMKIYETIGKRTILETLEK